MKFRNLENFRTGGIGSNMELSVPLPRTPYGRVYRYSPNPSAHPRLFVLGNRVDGFEVDAAKRSRMKQEPGQPGTVCPYSGVMDDDDAFLHPDDKDAAIELVSYAAVEDMTQAVSDMFDGLKRDFRSSKYIKFESRRPSRKPAPRFGRRDLMRELVCDHCGRDYGVFAIGLYCPDCGAPNVALHFAREVELVGKQVALAEGLPAGEEELAYRMLGNAHEDVLTAFEATMKTIYLHRKAIGGCAPESIKPPGNAFQNIEKTIARFEELGMNPFAQLGASELSTLSLNIQKRHVIGHNLGVVDAKFVEQAEGAKIGETVRLVGTDIRTFGTLCLKVVSRLDDWMADASGNLVGNPAESACAPEVNVARDLEPVGNLGALASAIGRWISQGSELGLTDIVDSGTLTAAFPEATEDQLADAAAELAADGFVETSATMAAVPHLHTTVDLFFAFDPAVHGTRPISDAAQIVKLVLAGEKTIGVAELHEASGLPIRRFNPAAAMVIAEIDEGRIGEEPWPQRYPARYFSVAPDDRVALKRLLKRFQG